MFLDEYEMKKDKTEYREKMHKEALKKRHDMQYCPICHVYESYITNVHCVREHGMTKKEVEAKYGKIVSGSQQWRLNNVSV